MARRLIDKILQRLYYAHGVDIIEVKGWDIGTAIQMKSSRPYYRRGLIIPYYYTIDSMKYRTQPFYVAPNATQSQVIPYLYNPYTDTRVYSGKADLLLFIWAENPVESGG